MVTRAKTCPKFQVRPSETLLGFRLCSRGGGEGGMRGCGAEGNTVMELVSVFKVNP